MRVLTAPAVVVCGCTGDPVVVVVVLAGHGVAVLGLPTWCLDRPPRGWALDALLDAVPVLFAARQGAPLDRRTAVGYRPRP